MSEQDQKPKDVLTAQEVAEIFALPGESVKTLYDSISGKQKDCGSCEWWHDEHCLSYDSEYSGKPRKLKDSCEEWEEKDV